MREKSRSSQIKNIRKINVKIAYIFNGIVCKKSENPSILLSFGSDVLTAAAQLEMGDRIHTGAAVASII